jgi:hypothetical protein
MVEVATYILYYIEAIFRGWFLHFTKKLATPKYSKLTKVESISMIFGFKMYRLGHRPYAVSFSRGIVVCLANSPKILVKA